MIDDRIAHGRSTPRHDMEEIRGCTAFVDQHLDESDGGERRLRGRLQDDRATGGDRRSDLVRHQIQREVEGCDGTDDTDRHPKGEPDLAFAGRQRIEGHDVPGEFARFSGRELKSSDRPIDLDSSRAERFGGLRGHDSREFLTSFGEHDRRAIEDGCPSMERKADRSTGRPDRSIDVVGRAGGNGSDDGTVERVANLDDRSGTAERFSGETQGVRWLDRHELDDTETMGTDRARSHPYLSAPKGFLSFAHRGGTGHAPENTLAAFRHAYELGYRHLETDVHATADGVLVAFHDEDLGRTCGRPGLINDLRWSQVAEARVAGEHPVPLLSDLLEEFPDARFNIDAKSDASVEPLLAVLHRHACLDRVCIGSFSHRRLVAVRRRVNVCTSASPIEVARWIAGSVSAGPSCFQVPIAQGSIKVVTSRTIDRAHRAGRPVHVWTVDDPIEMQRLIDLGVDGIMTDDPVTLRRVAIENDLWSAP